MSKNFTNELKEVYTLVGNRQKELGEYFKILEEDDDDTFADMNRYIDKFIQKIGLSLVKENRLSVLSRLISLRDEQLVQSLVKENFSDEKISEIKELAYLWVKEFYIQRHEEFLQSIEEKELLNEFYRRLLRGVHEVGIAMSEWQSLWTKHIINTINPELQHEFGDETVAFLEKQKLYDTDENGNKADRAYSVLKKDKSGYSVQAYAEFFENEVNEVTKAYETLIKDLELLEDEDTNQKEVYISYFKTLQNAFGEKERKNLIQRWQDVDRAWMKVTSPLQVGHPLEYYEDHFRKAVALEWDVRISNPDNLGADKTYKNILYMYNTLFEKLGSQKKKVLELTLANLQRVGLYIGRPALFYGAEFNGLFSAQVVPNDEQVSKEEGKKIFAFSDNILDSLRAKPFLKIQNKIFGKEFMDVERELVFKKSELWHKVYEVTTIGHEYGHILWLDNDTESRMNVSGVFKNIEEFKATTGGLMAFFMNEDESCKSYVLSDVIKRAVGLIGWMKTDEVQPYYCEGLIHLKGLFETQVLSFDESLSIDTSDDAYERLKKWYQTTYEDLASHYLAKKDANEFLSKYAVKINHSYMPLDKKVKSFVDYYWSLHQDIGRDIDEDEHREDWI
ncbi:invasion protein CiaB [Sulfurospirillum arcachonense]|uniref:invasion protein CiaB n=1 Tax=Sulfurospirillum arcachonense TaxID=57666 RepID=UPI000468ECD2|nr:invasion protein CiaB [Sulfurospirillum arcachonense]